MYQHTRRNLNSQDGDSLQRCYKGESKDIFNFTEWSDEDNRPPLIDPKGFLTNSNEDDGNYKIQVE